MQERSSKSVKIINLTYLVLFCVTSLYGCEKGKTSENKTLLDSKVKLVYTEFEMVQEKDHFNEKTSDIKVMNFNTKEFFYITKDDFVDGEPKWSPDGKSILFKTIRGYDNLTLKILGTEGPFKFVIYDIKENTFKNLVIKYQLDKHESLRLNYDNIQWNNQGDKFLFKFHNNKIMKCNLEGDSARMLKEFTQNQLLQNFTITDNDSLWIFRGRPSALKKVIYLYDNRDSSSIVINNYNVYRICDYSKHKKTILFNDFNNNLYEYSLISREVKKLDIPIIESPMVLTECKYIDEKKLVCLIEKLYNNNENLLPNAEIVLMDLEKQKLEWLTNDGLGKRDLDIFIRNDK